jgi:[acyl-carrier-protein] S-malonyltransferase
MSKIAYLFPGQGSQSQGMLKDIAESFEQIGNTYGEASEVLGYDLWEVVQQQADKLNQTEVTQPALLTASVAIWRILQDSGLPSPEYMAGHSLGEYSALVCAGVVNFSEAVKLVEMRGQFMQQAVPSGTGAMYAIIGLDDESIQAICTQTAQEMDQVVSPVNYNSPGQVVIAGNAEAVAKAGEQCKEAGAKRALPLPVSVPSHCALMQPAAEKMRDEMENITFTSPQIPVINNVDVSIETDAQSIKNALIRQLASPVRWTETVQFLADQQVVQSYEVGPGKVISGLVKRIDKRFACEPVGEVSALNSILERSK